MDGSLETEVSKGTLNNEDACVLINFTRVQTALCPSYCKSRLAWESTLP